MGEGNKVQSGWLGFHCLTTDRGGHEGWHCRAGTVMPPQSCQAAGDNLSVLSGWTAKNGKQRRKKVLQPDFGSQEGL